jgi:hypothetical protein
LCLNPLHVSGVKRPSSGGTTLAVFGVICVHLQPANSYKYTQRTPESASVVPPEDGCLTFETCRGLRYNKVIVKVKVYEVGYIIVIHG